MKNKPNFSAIWIICLFAFLLVSDKLISQSENNTNSSIDALLSGDIPAVSARIATMYGADPEVVERYVQASVNLESRVGIAAPVIIAIAIQESRFKSELFTQAGNPFGIKAGKPWLGPTYSKWNDGKETMFRAYNSPEEAIWDLGNFVKSRDWYVDVFDCPVNDSRCVIDGLKQTDSEPGYSMNPAWDEAIMDIIKKVGLQGLATR